jgi:hypothetical protein
MSPIVKHAVALGGSVSAVLIGGVVGYYAASVATGLSLELGPAAPFIGAASGLIVGSVAGVAAYIGGRTTTVFLMRNLWPALYLAYENEQIAAVKDEIARRLRKAQVLE